MNLNKQRFLFLILFFYAMISYTNTLVLSETSDVVGAIEYGEVEANETLDEVGRRFDVGYFELLRANPQIDVHYSLAANSQLVIPTQYILPEVPRKGIVINLAEYRLYYFPPNENVVITFPIGIGRKGWNTPLGITKIVSKVANPIWRPTDNLRAEAEKNGDFLPDEFPAGPYNPLGQHALRLGWPTFLIHGTNKVTGIGSRVSAGCIRMFPEDVEYLFHRVAIGTSVRVINEPVKLGKQQGKWIIQIHPLLNKKRGMELHTLVEQQLKRHNLLNLSNSKVLQHELVSPSGLIQYFQKT